jgi:hypothetical protein
MTTEYFYRLFNNIKTVAIYKKLDDAGWRYLSCDRGSIIRWVPASDIAYGDTEVYPLDLECLDFLEPAVRDFLIRELI